MMLACEAYGSILLWLLVYSGNLVTCVPLTDWPQLLSAADRATDEARALSHQLESQLDAEATRQAAIASRLETEAHRAAMKAQALQDQADEAKLRAFEAVIEGQAVADRERALEANEREEDRELLNAIAENPTGIDVLMEREPPVLHKRNAAVRSRTSPEDVDALEALRVLYLQRVLANQQHRREEAPDVSEFLNPSNRLVYIPPSVTWSGRSPIAGDEGEEEEASELIPFRDLLLSRAHHSSVNHANHPERPFAPSLDEESDEEGYEHGY